LCEEAISHVVTVCSLRRNYRTPKIRLMFYGQWWRHGSWPSIPRNLCRQCWLAQWTISNGTSASPQPGNWTRTTRKYIWQITCGFLSKCKPNGVLLRSRRLWSSNRGKRDGRSTVPNMQTG